MAADSQHLKMSILPLLRARSLDEPGAGIPHAWISEGSSETGAPTVMALNMRYITPILAIIAVPLCSAQFAAVELSRDDLISFYQVPVEKRPACKVQWSVSKRTVFKLMLECRTRDNSEWKVIQSVARRPTNVFT